MAEWRITDGTFKGFRFHVAVPGTQSQVGMTDQDITTERRLQISEKAGIDGAEVEDFGAKARTFNATVVFFGGDYERKLEEFEEILNEGTTGELILPDLRQAVQAKFQRATRRTNSQDGFSTTMQVSWIEDRSRSVTASDLQNIEDAQEALQSGNTEQGLPTVLEQASKAQSTVDKALDALNNNVFLQAVEAAENSVTNIRVKINSALTIARNQRQDILNTVSRLRTGLNGLKSAVNGLKNYTDLLNLALSESNPLRVNTGLGAQDFKQADTVSTTVVSGLLKVKVDETEQTPIQSFSEGEAALEASVYELTQLAEELESITEGTTDDYAQTSTVMINSIRDLIYIIKDKPVLQVLTQSEISLIEVCFNNKVDIDDLDRVYKLNTHLDDILCIPRLTVVNL